MLVWLTFLIVLLATGLVATVAATLGAQDGYEDDRGFHPLPNRMHGGLSQQAPPVLTR